ncbi:hypothetical protein EVAR_69159_1 [Eumeta japonica]|uniref:Uncharacterized protein n=1 Tax=Eumeta variegata TaxID=151549 RepID=A0A4C1ZCI0_EUMVA|nr:hypothetical protein EVAR_69159_1 [Eumeta japonica]
MSGTRCGPPPPPSPSYATDTDQPHVNRPMSSSAGAGSESADVGIALTLATYECFGVLTGGGVRVDSVNAFCTLQRGSNSGAGAGSGPPLLVSAVGIGNLDD